MIMEATGVKINFIVPASDDSEQLTAMIASGELPDIMTVEGWWDSNARMLTYQMAQEGYIWSGVLYHEPLKSALIYYRPDDIEHAKLDAELEIPLWIQLVWPLAAAFLTLILTVFELSL